MKACTTQQKSPTSKSKGSSKNHVILQGKWKEHDLYTIMMWGTIPGAPEQTIHWLLVNIHGNPKTTFEESLHTGDTLLPYKIPSMPQPNYTYHLGIFKQHETIPYIKVQRQKFDVNDFIEMYELVKVSELVKKA